MSSFYSMSCFNYEMSWINELSLLNLIYYIYFKEFVFNYVHDEGKKFTF